MPRTLFQYKPRVKGRDHKLDFQGESVTPNDSTDLPSGMCAGIVVTGSTGNVAVQLDDDSTAVLTITVANEPYLVQCSRVLSTGTTATGVVALYAGATFGN